MRVTAQGGDTDLIEVGYGFDIDLVTGDSSPEILGGSLGR